MPPGANVIIFDVNETLLDISSLEPHFAAWFDDAAAMRQWFGELVLYSQALTLAGRYTDFGDLAAAILEMIARIRHSPLPDDAARNLKSAIENLPAHADVEPGLARLRESGFRLVTLTNSSAQTQHRQLKQAGIAHLFEAQFSVETVAAYKPAPTTYESVSTALDCPPSKMVMVACHAWDIIGARAAGCQTGFVRRHGNEQPSMPNAQALYAADTLVALADILIDQRDSKTG